MGKKSLADRLVLYSIIILVVYVAIIACLHIRSRQTTEYKNFVVGIDYMILYTAGKTALSGDVAGIYHTPEQHAMTLQDIGYEIPDDMHWFYPPTLLLALVSALSVLPFCASYFLWIASTLALAVFGCATMLPKKKSLALLAVSFPAVMYNFRWGQNGFLSTALLAAGIGLMETSPVLSGLMFGLLTYKTWLAVFPLLVLLVTRKWKVFGWSCFFTVLTGGISLAVVGAETWQAFFHQIFTTGTTLFTSIWENSSAIQPTMLTALRLLGIEGALLYVILALLSIAVTYLVAMVFRNTERLALRGSAMVLGIFAVIPYYIEYDLMLLSIPTILLIYDCMQEGYAKTDFVAVGASWLMPLINLSLVRATRIQICPFVSIALLIYVFLRARKSSRKGLSADRLSQDSISTAPTAEQSRK